jgi:UDP-N-acetylmuramoylalanine--D-glutamate ligase
VPSPSIDLSFFAGLPVAVLGLGKSGLSAAQALQAAGAEVWAWDDNEDQRAKARAVEIPLVDLNQVNWQEVTSLILSPGIPHTFPQPHPIVAEAKKHNIESSAISSCWAAPSATRATSASPAPTASRPPPR